MLKTNVKNEVKKICIDEGISLTELAGKIDTSKQYMSRQLGKSTIVNGKLIEAFEAIGYDVEIKFVKRGNE
jgi:hypothetical protein